MMPTSSELTAGELEQTVGSVLQTMVGLEVAPIEANWSPRPDGLTATVHLAGTWRGALVFETNRIQACHLAGRFLSIAPPAVLDDVVRDVLGEIVNMIAGNLKSILAPGAALSMPSVADGSDYSFRVCKGMIVERQAFASAEGVFWVSRIATP